MNDCHPRSIHRPFITRRAGTWRKPPAKSSPRFGIQRPRGADADASAQVRLLFHPNLAPYILEHEWPCQKVSARKPEGWPNHSGIAATLELELYITQDLIRWIMGWGNRVRVLAPDSLRKRIQDEHRKAAEQS